MSNKRNQILAAIAASQKNVIASVAKNVIETKLEKPNKEKKETKKSKSSRQTEIVVNQNSPVLVPLQEEE